MPKRAVTRLHILLVLPAVVAAFMLLTACGPAETEHGERPVRVGMARAPLTFDPRYASDSTATRINRLIYRALTDFGPNGAPQPQLATWEQITPVQYRFRLLPERAPFHHGAPVTAEDVAATYRSILDTTNPSPHKGSLEHIDRIEVLDPDTLDVHLSRPDFRLPEQMDIGILPAALIEDGHPFGEHPVGSGPLRRIDGGNDFLWRFRRVDDGRVIEFHQVSEPTVRALKLMRGEIDLIQNDLPPETIAYLQAQPGLKIEQQPGMTFAYLGFNLTHPWTGKLELRNAIAQGIDREAIVRHMFHGNARPALSMLRPGHWALAPDLAPIVYDPAMARKQIAALGHGPENPLRLVYKTSADPFRRRLATVLQDQLKQVGVDVTIQSHDWGTFYGDIKAGRFEMYSLAWTSLHSPDVFRNVCHSESLPPRGANRGGYRSAEMDRQLDIADLSQNPEQRLAALHRVQQLFRDDLIYVPLWYEGHTAIHDAQLQGYNLYSDGRYDDLARVNWAPTANN